MSCQGKRRYLGRIKTRKHRGSRKLQPLTRQGNQECLKRRHRGGGVEPGEGHPWFRKEAEKSTSPVGE